MNTSIKTVIFTALMLLPFSAFSQTSVGITTVKDLDVNGMRIGTVHTRAQVEARWGVPTRYRSHPSECGLSETYDYLDPTNGQNSQFRFIENGVFHSFTIRSRNFAIFTAHNGGIRVGDNISRLQTIGIGTARHQTGRGYSTLGWQGVDDFLIFRHTTAGIITNIVFFSPM